MDLIQKLEHLRTLDNTAFYKWSAGKSRIAGSFILLSNLRLNIVACSGGRIWFSSAAPVMYMDRGRSVIHYSDADVLTVTEGPRKGINVLSRYLKEGEEAVKAAYCASAELTEDSDCGKWMAHKVLSMTQAPVYPVYALMMPSLFRITKNLEHIKPVFTSEVVQAIGGTRTDTLEVLMEKFRKHQALISVRTADGYILPNDSVACGGCCVAASSGITRSGSAVHMIACNVLRDLMKSPAFDIHIGEENK